MVQDVLDQFVKGKSEPSLQLIFIYGEAILRRAVSPIRRFWYIYIQLVKEVVFGQQETDMGSTKNRRAKRNMVWGT